MLQIMGFTNPEYAEDEGPNAAEFVAWQQALTRAGALISGGYLADYQLASSVQASRQGEQLITNGPFPESREYLGGWSIIDVSDLAAALSWARSCPGAKYGRVEVRPVQG